MIKLLVVGTVAVDALETPYGRKDEVFGGSASYFSYSASHFVSPVSLVAVVGEDFPAAYRAVLEERKIDLSRLQVAPGKTFRWKGRYENDMNVAHTIDTQLNVLEGFHPDLKGDKEVEYLFLANVDPEIQLQLIDQIHRPLCKLVALDTMNFWIKSKPAALREVLRRIDLLVINEGEARDLVQEPNLIRAARKIQELGPDRVVIKKGEHGVLLFDGPRFFALPAYPLENVFDPTGAGDTFAGGLMGALAKSGDLSFEGLKKAVVYGSVMASFVVEAFGLERLRTLDAQALEIRHQDFKRFSAF